MSHITYHLAYPTDSNPAAALSKRDIQSFYTCLAAWGLWIVDNWGVEESQPEALLADAAETGEIEQGEEDTGVLRRGDIAVSLLNMLGSSAMDPEQPISAQDSKCALMFLEALTRGRPPLERLYAALSPVFKPRNVTMSWEDADLSIMEDRLKRLQALMAPATDDNPASATDAPQQTAMAVDTPNAPREIVAPGWQLAPATWKPCPIGVFAT